MKLTVIDWTSDGAVRYLDQTRLPHEEVYREARTVEEMAEAIKVLRVRGAPLIGVAGAMGFAAAVTHRAREGTVTTEWVAGAAARLAEARPTAVNLAWAIDRMRSAAAAGGADSTKLASALRAEAQQIWDEDAAMCRAIGEAGAELIPLDATILTHCNAGALATGGIGTALAAIYEAHAQGKRPRVISTETRPLCQGARLTVWELQRERVPVTSIVDSAAGAVLAAGSVDLVITGADRIAANGDVANKIGTYAIAVLAREHDVPFYVAAPSSTFDPSLPSGDRIPIEERAGSELDAAPGAVLYNPAFDVTPAALVRALITDRGVIRPPFASWIESLQCADSVEHPLDSRRSAT